MVEVKMIHDGKVKVVVNSDVQEFDISKIGNSKNSRLKQAFAKAANFLGDQSLHIQGRAFMASHLLFCENT